MLLLNAISCISFYSGEGESSAGNDSAPKGISFTPFTPPELFLALGLCRSYRTRGKHHFLGNNSEKCHGCLSSESICPLEFTWLMSSLHFSSALFCQGFLKVLEKPLQQMKKPWHDPALHHALPSIPVVLTISCLLQHGRDFGQQAHSVFTKVMY